MEYHSHGLALGNRIHIPQNQCKYNNSQIEQKQTREREKKKESLTIESNLYVNCKYYQTLMWHAPVCDGWCSFSGKKCFTISHNMKNSNFLSQKKLKTYEGIFPLLHWFIREFYLQNSINHILIIRFASFWDTQVFCWLMT